ncbi:MAG: tetratricopeptide repeat protein [Abyssibacter sp.]|uniref:tetratricopeptide repeat protein n=1 Tax=Abyssibacter sp. TaxID=2320200 RepID=UPI00321C3900
MTHHCSRIAILCLVVLAAGWEPAQAGLGGQQRATMLSEQIRRHPADPTLYLRRALIYADIGEFRQALADVDTAAELGPVENTLFVRGVLMYRLGQFDQALPLFDRFIAARPGHANARLYRARVLRDAGQYHAALRDYLAYFEITPNAEPGDYQMAARLMVMLSAFPGGQYTPDDALALLDQRRSSVGHAPQLQRYAIEIESGRCNSTAAIERLHALHPNAKRAPRWHLQLAEQSLLAHSPHAANAALTQAARLLDQRRPTASKTRLQRRHAFVSDLVAAFSANRLTPETAAEVLERHYAGASLPGPTRHHHGDPTLAHHHSAQAHPHDDPIGPAAPPPALLQGFERPAASTEDDASTLDAAIQPFFACLRQRLQ